MLSCYDAVMPYTQKQQQALKQFLAGESAKKIAVQLQITPRCVQGWVKQYDWQDLAVSQSSRQMMQQFIVGQQQLAHQLDQLCALLKQTITNKPIAIAGNTEKSSRKTSRSGRKPNKIKNNIDLIPQDAWHKVDSTLFAYQQQMEHIKNDPLTFRNRIILKSRQIGMTYYFAYEAFRDACYTGQNQVFLSASKSQSEIFKSYIKQFALQMGELELKGRDQIDLSNGASLYFLSTNSHTAQGYHGHLYVDEFFWIPKFKQLKKLASGIAMHKHWRRTYFSTPSTKSHEAYPFWNGEAVGDEIDTSRKQLKHGKLCDDGAYRQIITVNDAIAGGADFFDIKQLKQEYSAEEYNNLLLCQFADDSNSVIPMQQLLACMVDAIDEWQDVDFNSNHPVGNQPVWIGYDPSALQDESSVVVMLPPKKLGGVFRCIEKYRWRGQSFEYQAGQIEDLCQRFHVAEIAIDSTGIGYGVVEIVRQFFPAVYEIKYSIQTKERLVHKAKDVIANKRLQFDASWQDMVQSFLMLKQAETSLGKATFKAQRNNTNSHADLAFACMHALYMEPVDFKFVREPLISFG